MGKIIFIDVDGTLIDYENHLPESAANAVRMARNNGHKVYISTGRSRAEIYDYIWEIGLDGMIGGNGSYVEHDGQVVFHKKITPDQCRRVVDWLHCRKLEFYLESNNGLFASEHFEERAESAVREYCRRKNKPGAAEVTVRSSFPEMIFGGELYRNDVNKISYLLKSYNDYLETREQFPDMENGTWGGAGETALFGDLGVKDISKANAIECLLQFLGAKREDTYAFGDARVDIPMLEFCQVGIAMGNGGEEVKRIADYITDDVEKDGLYKAFLHFGLI